MRHLFHHLYPFLVAALVAWGFTSLTTHYGLGAHNAGAIDGILIALGCYYLGWHNWNPETR